MSNENLLSAEQDDGFCRKVIDKLAGQASADTARDQDFDSYGLEKAAVPVA